MNNEYMTLEDFICILRKRLKIILFTAVFFTLVSAIISFYIIDPKYEAITKFFIGKESIGEEKNYSQNDVIMYQNLMKSYSEVIKTPDIILSSIEKYKMTSDVKEIIERLEVVAIADTQILEVSYRSISPDEANYFLNNLTNNFINISKELVPNGNIKIIQKVRVSEEPVIPNKKINLIIGVLSGIVIGILFAFIAEILDKTIRNKEELENIIDIPIIGILPYIDK